MKNENGKKRNVTLTIDQMPVRAARAAKPAKEHLAAGGVPRDADRDGSASLTAGSATRKKEWPCAISAEHYSLLCEEAEEVGFEVEETAEMIIGSLGGDASGETAFSREKFNAVVEAWGGIDFPSARKRIATACGGAGARLNKPSS